MIQDFDFHLHTDNSDGQYSVNQIVELLKANNIKYFSITDHDNINSVSKIDGLDLKGMKYISGVEISSIYNDKYEMHILGYGFDHTNEALCKSLNYCKAQRQKRIIAIASEVEKRSCITITENEKQYLLQQNNPGRPHLAKILVDHKVVKDTNEAFLKYLSGIKCDIKYRLSTKEAFDVIHKAGGIVLLAHPVKVEKKYHIDIEELIDGLITEGLDGIEIGNSLHCYQDVLRYQQLALEKGLLTSAGSDYHGPFVKKDVQIGIVYNSCEEKKIDVEQLTFLKEVKE